MIMDIEEIISIFAKNGNKEMVETLRIIQSRGIDEVTLNFILLSVIYSYNLSFYLFYN